MVSLAADGPVLIAFGEEPVVKDISRWSKPRSGDKDRLGGPDLLFPGISGVQPVVAAWGEDLRHSRFRGGVRHRNIPLCSTRFLPLD